jgi:hypothetical protein
MDILSFLIGYQAAQKAEGGGSGGSGGSGGTLKYFKKYVRTINGTWGERVSLDFGFTPGFILVVPNSMTISGSANFLFCGMTQSFAEAIGLDSPSGFYVYHYNNTTTQTSTGTWSIDKFDENMHIYNADSTGFNFGKKCARGSAYVIAFGL